MAAGLSARTALKPRRPPVSRKWKISPAKRLPGSAAAGARKGSVALVRPDKFVYALAPASGAADIVTHALRAMKADRAPTVNAPEIRLRIPALEVMERSGVETAILSVSTPGVEPGDVNEARAMTRRLSEYEVIRAHPGRIGSFATSTLPNVEGALVSRSEEGKRLDS